MKGIQLGNLKNIMKVLMYSSYEFDRPIIENALHGKLEFVYTDQPLNEDTVQLGFEAISLFIPTKLPLQYSINYIFMGSGILVYVL
jgi:D-lactate dehydrogenase